jgi:hypothetical protein
MAYYHSALRVCEYPKWNFNLAQRKAIKEGFVTLAAGSAFMHGSHTILGTAYDISAISVITYTAYQAIFEKMNTTSNILLNLNNRTQNIESKNLTNLYTFFSMKMPLEKWTAEIYDLNDHFQRDYKIIFTALWASAWYLSLPKFVVDAILPKLEGILLNGDQIRFVNQDWKPQALELLNKISISFADKVRIQLKFLGVIIKIGWAFVWQEKIIPVPKWIITNHRVQTFGHFITPILNEIASLLEGFP